MILKRHRYGTEYSAYTSFLDKVFAAKGIEESERGAYLHPSFRPAKSLTDFRGLVEAAELVKKLMAEKKRILLFSDYDCDGTLAASIMMRAFRKFSYEDVDYRMPSRFGEGYGLSLNAVKEIKEAGYDAIITLDLGIRDLRAVELAKELGLTVLVTDHHNVGEELPLADVVLNPKLSDEKTGFYMLCGAGVALYLAAAMLDDEDMDDLLQLAAIATVADLVPLTLDNRAIVKKGLELIKAGPICGIKALIAVSSISLGDFEEEDIAFRLAPRINAAGRMSTADSVVELMLTEDEERAGELAEELDRFNVMRKEVEADIIEEARELIESKGNKDGSPVNVVWGEDWHQGVIGIVASKLVEAYMKPAIVMSLKDSVFKASTRSVKSYSIYSAVQAAESALIKFGGHEMACGFSLEEDRLDDFLALLGAYVEEHVPNFEEAASLDVSAELPVSLLTHESLDLLKLMKPFGLGNESPFFSTKDFRILSSYYVGRDKATLKLKLIKDGRQLDAVLFKAPSDAGLSQGYRADVVYAMKENNFRDVRSLDLVIEDMRIYDPARGELQKLAFCLYALKLNRRIMAEGGDFTLISRRSASEDVIWETLNKGKRIGVNSFEALLELYYLLYDKGLSYEEIAKGEGPAANIVILPTKDDSCSYHFRKGFYGTEDRERKACYQKLILDDMHFDRELFAKTYTDLKREGSLNLMDYLMKSDRLMGRIMALEFFKEAGFISVEEGSCSFSTEEHSKTDFKLSKVNQAYRSFILSELAS